MTIETIVTDVEGTTSSIAFVKDCLFPYAAEHLPDFVRRQADEPAVAEQIDAVRQAMGEAAADLEQVIARLLRWIAEDVKATPLKTLQGLVWRQGFEDGSLQAPVYDDAWACLQRWQAAGYRLAVYSSGSVQAQRLFFGHTEHGDLSSLFSAHFDTTSGHKQEADSYRRIATDLAASEPATLLFLSDVAAECDAARAAGWQTILVRRACETGQPPGEDGQPPYPVVPDFWDIDRWLAD